MPSLDAIPDGVHVFVDSTILHYACVQFPPATAQCIRFLTRVSQSEITASVTVPIVNDAIHKVMCSEAVARFNRPRAGLVSWLKQNPVEVRQLKSAGTLLDLIGALPLELLPLNIELLREGQQAVDQFGLLAGDALILAVMKHHSISHLATNDDDFDQVPSFSIWKPR